MTNSVQFVTNDSGQKTAVVLPIADYERLMEDLGDLFITLKPPAFLMKIEKKLLN